MAQLDEQVQVNAERNTVWVHAMDGSTVGRFSKRFGLDVHTTITAQMNGAAQCLHCTHVTPGQADWIKFCELMELHHSIKVNQTLLEFP